MVVFLLVFVSASLIGCSVEALSAWWLPWDGEGGFVDILRVCCFLVLRLYYFDAFFTAVLALCCLTMAMVAHNL